jgi:geranylgeranyl reductase
MEELKNNPQSDITSREQSSFESLLLGMENKYDVVIVGAGPGGLNCAKVLANANKKVLLLEKNPEIGPKVCAGGLTKKSIEYLGLPDDVGGKRFDYIWFKTKRSQTKIDAGKNFVCTIDRKELGQWQKKELENTSVEIRTNSTVTKIEKNKLTINENEDVYFDCLVGADGSNSFVRRSLGIKTRWVGAGIFYYIENVKQDVEIIFDGKLFSAWYAWIFPFGKDTITIGTAAFGKLIPLSRSKKNLETWLDLKGYTYKKENFVAHPINCDYRGYCFGNKFLVGDAAGLASPFSGEGIYQALISGEVVAKKIINPKYLSWKMESIRCQHRLHYLFAAGIWILGPLREVQFEFVTFISKNKHMARFLLWLLT